MRVVSNTSPISNLAIIGRLDFLQRRYGRVLIPPTVASELAALSHPAAKTRIQTAFAEGWLVVETPRALIFQYSISIDAGETEAIALAVSARADVLLMDEKRGRLCAREAVPELGLAGVLGELLHAKRNGWIPSMRDEIRRLRSEARFFIDPQIEEFILKEGGE